MADEEKNKDIVVEEDNLIHLSTGVILRGKAMPPGVFINLAVNNPPPQAPMYKVGDNFFSNADDPTYIEQFKFWSDNKNKDMLNAMINFGTELEKVEKGLPKLEDTDWVEILELSGIRTRPENKSWRYLFWVMMVAAPTTDDWSKITEVVGRLTGVPERDVDSASKFPGSS